MSKDSTKSNSHYRMPGKLWKLLKKHLPKEPQVRMPGRPRVSNRAVLDGIWHVLWTGCQWKSIEKEWFNVSSSVLHERFQTWHLNFAQNKAQFTVGETGMPVLVKGFGEFVDLVQGNGDDISLCVEFYFS